MIRGRWGKAAYETELPHIDVKGQTFPMEEWGGLNVSSDQTFETFWATILCCL